MATDKIKMRVARGRTISDGQRTWTGGEEIELPADEARHLHKLGFLKGEGEGDTRPSSDSWVTQRDATASVTVFEPHETPAGRRS